MLMQHFSFRTIRALLPFAAAAVSLLSAGCGSPLTLYPEFPAKKAAIQKSMILSDYVVLDATIGDTAQVDIEENKSVAIALMDEVGDQLNEKNYNIENRLLSSMGLPLNPGTHARVINTKAEHDLDEEWLELHRPPFYVYRVFEKDSTLLHLLASFYSALLNATKLEGQPNPIIKEAVPLGQTIGGGTWFVLLTAGYNIPVVRELGIEPPGLRDPFNPLEMYRTTHIMMMLFVVDTESGELIWADQIHEKGGTIHRNRMMRIVGKMTSSLP